MLSTSKKIMLGIGFSLIPILVNISWYYTQDLTITFGILFVLLYLVPIIISKLIDYDINSLLTYKQISFSSSSSTKMTYLIIWLVISSAVIILNIYLKLFVNVLPTSLIAMFPHFNNQILTYLYVLLGLFLMVMAFYQEVVVYYGILTYILPSGIMEMLLLAAFHTSTWICFSMRFFVDYQSKVAFLILTFLFYVSLVDLKNKCSYKDATYVYIGVSLWSFILLFLYAVLYEEGKIHGISILLNNPGNMMNKL